MVKFEIYCGKDGDFYWRLLDGDETVATGGEGFVSPESIIGSIKNVCTEVGENTPIVEDSSEEESGKVTRFAYYRQSDDQYGWRLQNQGNNQIIAVSHDGFPTKEKAVEECKRVKTIVLTVPPHEFSNPNDDPAKKPKDEDQTDTHGIPGS